MPRLSPAAALQVIRLLHTLVWAALVAVILAIPVAAWQRRFGLMLGLAAVIVGEGLVLALNQGRCPLTNVAARYTTDRSDNFDIYLPRFVARYNKVIFSALYLAGLGFGLLRWWRG